MAADYIRSCHAVSGYVPDPELHSVIKDWNDLQMWERLLGLKGKVVDDTPSRFAEAIDLPTLTDRQFQLEQKVNLSLSTFFKDVENAPLPDPRPIMWKN